MTRITGISLRRVLDSRGNPTVEADVLTESGGFGRGAAPSGASTGEYEAIELPANESIAKAREHAVPRLEGVYAGDQRAVDNALRAADGTDDFSAIGANSAVAISMAAAKAAADVLGAPLYQHLGGAFRGENFPIPLGNVVGGGEHAKEATHIQEFLAAPVGAPSVSEAVFANAAVHAAVADVLDERGVPAAKGDEGAWAPPISDADAFEVVDEAVDRVEEDVGFEIRFGLDMAAAELYDDDQEAYVYGEETKSTDEQIDYVADLVDEYDLAYVEDPLDENDYEAFAELTDRVGDRTMICGDDLFRHQRRAAPGRDRHGRGQQHPDQAEPDRDAVGHVRRYRTRRSQRVRDDHFPPLGRDGGHDHRTPRRGDRCQVHQDRHGRRRAHRQAERTGPHRGRRGMTGSHHA